MLGKWTPTPLICLIGGGGGVGKGWSWITMGMLYFSNMNRGDAILAPLPTTIVNESSYLIRPESRAGRGKILQRIRLEWGNLENGVRFWRRRMGGKGKEARLTEGLCRPQMPAVCGRSWPWPWESKGPVVPRIHFLQANDSLNWVEKASAGRQVSELL